MWKQKPESVSSQVFVPTPEPARPAAPLPARDAGMTPRATPVSADQATITKAIVVRGEITGSNPLYIDGTVEGKIHIPGERVTIGRHGHVLAAKDHAEPCITAREIVIMGSVTGSVFATDRVDIRAQATLTGNVSTARVSIEDGAYFRGGIDIRRDDKPPAAPAAESTQEVQPAEVVEV